MTKFTALPTDLAQTYRAGEPDAFGNPPKRKVSDGAGDPCRHCLRDIPESAEMLVLAHKPFDSTHPYAEDVGPVFLCADDCTPGGGADLPDILTTSPDYLIKGHPADDRIVYRTVAITPTPGIHARVDTIFANPKVAYIHVRSARNNCYQTRADRDT